MSTATYPSAQLPAAPPFTLEVPAGLVAHPAPGVLAVVRPVQEVEGTTPTVTVRADLVPAGTDPARVLDQLVAGQPEHLEQTVPTDVPAGGDPTAWRRLVREAGGTQLHQLVSVAVLGVRHTGDLSTALTVVSTWTREQAPGWGELVQDVHRSFRVAGAPAAPAA